VEWDVQFDAAFLAELEEIERNTGSSAVREEVAALALLLRQFGPQLQRPHCDTLKGSKHANMKELRFTLRMGNGAWPSPSIRDARQSSWSEAASRARRRNAFTAS